MTAPPGLKIGFRNGSQIDIWARTPIFGRTTTREHVEGRAEAVLSSAQILRGKIERGDMNLQGGERRGDLA